jgi:hypothetical protein
MALVETTLSAAVAVGDVEINVASGTSVAAGRLVQVDGEMMEVRTGYVTAATKVPVRRGLDGTAVAAHVSSARVVHGDAADFGSPGAGTVSASAPAGRPRRKVSYSAAGSMSLPSPGEDLLVCLHSTAFTLTVPVPTKDLDGCVVTFTGAAGAAYILEFTGGLGGASTNYETITFNTTGALFFQVLAMNETWRAALATPYSSGTSTNIAGTIG